MTDAITDAKEYLASQRDACFNEECVGYEAREKLGAVVTLAERQRDEINDAIDRITQSLSITYDAIITLGDAVDEVISALVELQNENTCKPIC